VLLDRPALLTLRNAKKMKGASFIEYPTSPSIGVALSYLLGLGAYGSYPDIQVLWERYSQAVDQGVRKDLVSRIQKMIYEKVMWIPLTNTSSPAAFGPRIKGNPYKIQPMIWFTAPFEDIELEK